MEVNIVGRFLVLIGVGISVISAASSRCRWHQLEARLFKELMIAFFLLAIMCFGYIFPAILTEESLANTVRQGQLLLAAFGLAALPFVVHGFAYLKEQPDNSKVNGAFLISGAFIAAQFLQSILAMS